MAYTCYNYQGKKYWFYMSDSFVEQIDERSVLNCEAYILFYQRLEDKSAVQQTATANAATATATADGQ